MSEELRQIALAVPCLGEEEHEALREPIVSGWVAQGPKVAAFEAEFCRLHGVAHGVACTSGTTALHLILAGLGVGPGDEVLVPSFTWVASVNAVLYTGATPVLLDVDPATYNLIPDQIDQHLTPRTKAIIAVHLFGLCADVSAIAEAAPGVPIVEDAACAAGASLGGEAAGGLGVAASFSFHPRKTLTTGEGGMVTTNDGRLSERMRSLRNHGGRMPVGAVGAPAPHTMLEFAELGFNYRLTDLQAALGLCQLSKLPGFVRARQRLAQRYADGLADLAWLSIPALDDGHSFQSFVCMVDETGLGRSRNVLMEQLAGVGIATRPGTHAVHLLDFHRQHLDVSVGRFPGATACDGRSMAIPMHNRLSDDDQDYVIEHLHRSAQ